MSPWEQNTMNRHSLGIKITGLAIDDDQKNLLTGTTV